jgi:hypothetical protein
MKVFRYCLKIWLSSVVIGTLLFYFVGDPTDDSSMTFWGYMAVCLGTTVYSLVSFCCSGLVYTFWPADRTPSGSKKASGPLGWILCKVRSLNYVFD